MFRTMSRLAALAACLLFVSALGPAHAADQDVYENLKGIINKGADLYNSGDRNGCYRLFEGALLSLKTQLADKPQVVKMIDEGLAAAEQEPSVGHRAFALRTTLVEVRKHFKEGGVAAADPEPKPVPKPDPEPEPKPKPKPKPEPKPDPEPKPEKALWERLGGEKAVSKVIDDFMFTASIDPKVNFDRGGKYKIDDDKAKDLHKKLVALVSTVSGGPIKYEGKSMLDAHKGMGITNAEFDAAAGHLKAALENNGVKPADLEALMQIVGTTRKDIVEEKGKPKPKEEDKDPFKKPDDKDPFKKPDDKDPFKNPEPEANAGSVAGQVTLNNKPVAEAEIVFHPKGGKGKPVAAITDEKGGFEITSLPPGEYGVTVMAGEKMPVPQIYADAKKSPLAFKVQKGPGNLAVFPLTLEPIPTKPAVKDKEPDGLDLDKLPLPEADKKP